MNLDELFAKLPRSEGMRQLRQVIEDLHARVAELERKRKK
jgi:hypothetical protein